MHVSKIVNHRIRCRFIKISVKGARVPKQADIILKTLYKDEGTNGRSNFIEGEPRAPYFV